MSIQCNDEEAIPVLLEGQGQETTNTTTTTTTTTPSSQRDENVSTLSIGELLYSSASYHAIVKPVSITMVLAFLAESFINTQQSRRDEEAALSNAYTVFHPSDMEGNSAGKTLGLSLVNGLVMVCAIGMLTFVIVLLYKYRCMKFLVGYMVVSLGFLLGLLGGYVFEVAIAKYRLAIDKFSYIFALYNFAIVGVISIFFQKGTPLWVTQGYLIAVSVILAWHLSHFDEWTAWTLLIMLALYDLCAVLTPCGPLKLLVNLMSQEGSPDMPGLLYEAPLPADVRRPRPTTNQRNSTSRNRRNNEQEQQEEEENPAQSNAETNVPPQTPPRQSGSTVGENEYTAAEQGPIINVASEGVEVEEQIQDQIQQEQQQTAVLPFAIARIYRLQPVNPPDWFLSNATTTDNNDDEEGESSPLSRRRRRYTQDQLRTELEVALPINGGCIERGPLNHDGEATFIVKNRRGIIRRVLIMDREGKVFEEREDEDGGDGRKNSIRLGLGDFIFYSVLVSKAGVYSFTTFAACALVILAGLGGTLILLAVYKHALPALPISIFLGVIFYLLTRMMIEPWIQTLFLKPYYV